MLNNKINKTMIFLENKIIEIKWKKIMIMNIDYIYDFNILKVINNF